VGSGGVLSHAPRRVQSMRMMIDAFSPEGITELAVDSIFMMPHLGVLSTVNKKAATQVFEKDCIIYLGTCIAPVGELKADAPVIRVQLKGSQTVDEVLHAATLKRYHFEEGEEVEASLTPLQKTLDLGEGPGKAVSKKLKAGVVGVVVDTRGRPEIQIPDTPSARVPLLAGWVDEMGEYPEAKS